MLQPGQTLRDYKIIDKLRKRGIGTDYKAEDVNLGRTVTIKEVNQIFTSTDEMVQKFKNDAKLNASLEHPNIVGLKTYFSEGDTFYLVMEYSKSEALRQKLSKGGVLPQNQCLAIFAHILEAVGYAHEKGIVHGDIKPANILIDSDNNIKVMDFGFAKISGISAYMSPEQVLQAKEPSKLSDVYSLGITFYEILTGKLPFQATSDDELKNKIAHDTPQSVKSFNSGYPERFDIAISKATQKKPGDRFKSCQEFLDFITSKTVLENKPKLPAIEKLPAANIATDDLDYDESKQIPAYLSTKPANVNQNKPKRAKTQQQSQVVYFAIGAVAILAAIVIYFVTREPSRASKDDNINTEQTTAKNDSPRKNEPPKEEMATLKGTVSVGNPVSLNDHDDKIHSLKFNPSGTLFASGSEDNTVKLWGVSGSNKAEISLITTFRGHNSSVNSVAFSPDGKYLASASNDFTIKIWSVNSKSLIKTLRGHGGYVNSVAFSSDSRYIASGSSDKTVRLWSVDDGSELKTMQGHSDVVWSVAFSPNTNIIASAGGAFDKTIRIWNAGSGQLAQVLRGHDATIFSLSFSDDGSYLASASFDKSVKVWSSGSSGEFSEYRTLPYQNDACWCVAFSPNNRMLAMGTALNDRKVKLWDISSSDLITTLSGHSSGINAVAFSPDGKLITTGGWDNLIKVWNIN